MEPLNEEQVLTCCALRFDGWQFLEDSAFDYDAALHQLFATGQMPHVSNERLALFFTLQRFLMKWGGEYEPKHGRYWRAFRTLFLACVDLDVEPRYCYEDYWETWRQRYQPRLAQCRALVQRIHQTMAYDDNAAPTL